MALILNIETSASVCSVAVTKDGAIEFHIESEPDMKHAEVLGKFIERALEEITRKEETLDAVAVSIGPGSYTGLRIGLSMTKGLCMARQIPLIGISTLKILAVKAMFSSHDWTGEELLLPMIDARRMEVYTAVYDAALNEIMPPQPLILDADSYSDVAKGKKMIAIGDGTEKASKILSRPDIVWAGTGCPLAIDMFALSEMAFRKQDFLDLAYSTPEYLKEYRTTAPKPKL